jgi:hypothetical protein
VLISAEAAEDGFPRPLSRENAFRILLGTDTFALSYVGYAGSRSAQVEAFQVLLRQPDAEAVFSDLHRRALTPGRLYALCGLKVLRLPRYDQAEDAVLKSDELVYFQAGCVTSPRPAREIVRSSEPSVMRLRPGETIEQWTARDESGGEGAAMDISGGGFPECFRAAQ